MPTFRDPFLRNATSNIARRRKSLSHKGRLTISSEPEDTFEWLTLAFECASRISVVLQLSEKNRANIFVRSNRGKDRGKILARIEDMTVIDNGRWIVSALEDTISLAAQYEEGREFDLDTIWDEVRLQAAQ